MILTALVMGITVIAGIGVVAAFWNDIVDFIKDTVEKVSRTLNRFVYGTKVFLKKLQEGIQEILKQYSKDGEIWTEITTTRTIPESEVPEEIRNKARYEQEVDITQELELQVTSG